jgi:hypothetical protein
MTDSHFRLVFFLLLFPVISKKAAAAAAQAFTLQNAFLGVGIACTVYIYLRTPSFGGP